MLRRGQGIESLSKGELRAGCKFISLPCRCIHLFHYSRHKRQLPIARASTKQLRMDFRSLNAILKKFTVVETGTVSKSRDLNTKLKLLDI